jgi:hypothetical protein
MMCMRRTACARFCLLVYVRLFFENLIRALLMFNGLRSRYDQPACRVYHSRTATPTPRHQRVWGGVCLPLLQTIDSALQRHRALLRFSHARYGSCGIVASSHNPVATSPARRGASSCVVEGRTARPLRALWAALSMRTVGSTSGPVRVRPRACKATVPAPPRLAVSCGVHGVATPGVTPASGLPAGTVCWGAAVGTGLRPCRMVRTRPAAPRASSPAVINATW